MKFRDRIKGDGSGNDESEKRYISEFLLPTDESISCAKIIESILESCVNQATILRLMSIAKGLSYYTLKKYLFYLIDYDFISYQGEKRVYAIKYEGWKLLSMIKRTRKYGHMCYRTDIVSKCE